MKIIYTANIRFPTEKAHGIQIANMCQAFAHLDNDVILTVPWRFNHIKNDPFTYYSVERNFKIVRLPSIDAIKLGRVGFWIQTISFLISTKLYLTFQKYDVLYTREQFTGLFFKNFILEILSVPNKITYLHKKSWNKASLLVVITSFIKKELIETGIAPEKIFIAPDGVDVEKFNLEGIEKEDARHKLGIPQKEKIVMYTGHLFGWKGAHILAHAASLLEDANFMFVGGTSTDITAFKDKFKSRSNIEILGHRQHEEIPYYLKAADVVVLPNTTEERVSTFYTSPLKLFEYMASGTPIVASRLPSITEVLNEENSILVGPDNPTDLANGIKYALDTDVSHLSEKAKRDVQEYSWDRRTKRIVERIQ